MDRIVIDDVQRKHDIMDIVLVHSHDQKKRKKETKSDILLIQAILEETTEIIDSPLPIEVEDEAGNGKKGIHQMERKTRMVHQGRQCLFKFKWSTDQQTKILRLN